MTDEEVMDEDDSDEPEDERTAVRRKARELLASLTPTAEDLAEREARRQRIRDAELLADQQRRERSRLETRRAPLAEAEARVETPQRKPFTTDEVLHAVGFRLGELRRYTDNLEKAIGTIWAELRTRHDSAEQRVTSTEARLAALEARIAVLETAIANRNLSKTENSLQVSPPPRSSNGGTDQGVAEPKQAACD